MVTRIKVYYKIMEVTHSGYCSDADNYREELQYKDDKIFERNKHPIPENQFNEKGHLLEDYWYNYVNWKEDERVDDLGHCCCCGGGRIYKIYKVKKIKDRSEDEYDEDEESSSGSDNDDELNSDN